MELISGNIQDPSFFQCYICLETLKKPKMCPVCSKLTCESCLRLWVEEKRSECPHCRKNLPLSRFADCERFVNDVKHIIKNMQKGEKQQMNCAQHKLIMQYYCQDCKIAICSDCGMFGDKHKGHKIVHLRKIYQQKKDLILNQLTVYDSKIEQHRKHSRFVESELQKLMILVNQKKRFVQQYFMGVLKRLDDEYSSKRAALESEGQKTAKQMQYYHNFRQSIYEQLEGNNESQLILKAEYFIASIHSFCERRESYQEEEYNIDTIDEIVPTYRSFSYELRDYELIEPGIVYSNTHIFSGIEWRLKIYPKGNGIAKDSHLSVFLEMSKAFHNQNKYEYKIQLTNHFDPKESVFREYSSTFQIGECWGYNHFLPLSAIENGFLSSSGTLIFTVSIRNPTYKSFSKDQTEYITYLEKKLNNNDNFDEEKLQRNSSQKRMKELAQSSQQIKQRLQKIFLGDEENKHMSFINQSKKIISSGQVDSNEREEQLLREAFEDSDGHSVNHD